HAGGDRRAARRCGGGCRKLDRLRGRYGFRRTGGHRVRYRRRHQQAKGVPQLHQCRRCQLELGQSRLYRHRDGGRLQGERANYLWRPPATPGQAASLMGFAIAEAEDMPDVAADSFSIAFGDFRAGYLVVDRTGVRVLRDPYSAKPYMLFYTTKRVGGGVQNFEAIKLIKFAVS